MKNLYFEIQYHTNWGEHLELDYSIDGAAQKRLVMQTDDGQRWHISFQVNDDARHIRHAYLVADEHGNILRTEPNSWRLFYFNHRSSLLFCDAWATQSLDTIYHRTAFENCIMLPRGADKLHMEHLTATYLLQLHALPPEDGYKWAVVGNNAAWGKWDITQARILQRTGTYEWTLPLSRNDYEFGLEYKYVLINTLNPKHYIWEDGVNRSICVHKMPQATSIIRQDENPQIYVQKWKGTGCVIPVFSLKSKGSFGIGDFGDLKLFVHWAADTGLKAVQLLPINDTTRCGGWQDSYPYNGISVHALHPIYLDPREWKNSKAYALCKDEGERLNELKELDYEGAYKLKCKFARQLYAEIGNTILKSCAYKQYEYDNSYWIQSYAEFCAYRDHFHTANFRVWPKKAGTNNIASPDLSEEFKFHKFVQFLLHRQMSEVHEDARKYGVILKGDIPIGICPDSVPAWTNGKLFHFDGQAGAPPDDFAVHGQNWGFPTYNWEEMSKDNYLWWRLRLHHMEQYFDAYRIDHVLGFFRIWEIPSQQVYGVLGRFRPALPYSKEEICNYGFSESIEKYTHPFVSDKQFAHLKEEYGNDLERIYFEKCEYGYTLKKDYRTQRDVERLVPEGKVRNLLMDVIAEVLFIEDPDKQQYYHPRISAQTTQIFKELPRNEQDAYNRLYDQFFYFRHNEFWAEEAMKKMPIITKSEHFQSKEPLLYPLEGNGMLPCAEDLGMVPASVKGVLERLQILSLEIQRMPKEYGLRFSNLGHNPYLSVATIATHDMPPFRLWWKENKEQTQAFWNHVLEHSGEAPEEATPEICEDIVSRHINCPSMLCMIALQDLLGISPTLRNDDIASEQINVPANPHHYWRYRMHLTIEHLIQATEFNEKLRGLVNRK